MILRSLDVLLH